MRRSSVPTGNDRSTKQIAQNRRLFDQRNQKNSNWQSKFDAKQPVRFNLLRSVSVDAESHYSDYVRHHEDQSKKRKEEEKRNTAAELMRKQSIQRSISQTSPAFDQLQIGTSRRTFEWQFQGGLTRNSVMPADLKKFRDEMLRSHNLLRELHHSPALIVSDSMNHQAQQYAMHAAELGHHKSVYQSKYGENYWRSIGTHCRAAIAAKNWYEESLRYDFQLNGVSQVGTENFTQLVWKSTQRIGIGMCRGTNGLFVIVLYDPPGNVSGMYRDNVLPKRTDSPVD